MFRSTLEISAYCDEFSDGDTVFSLYCGLSGEHNGIRFHYPHPNGERSVYQAYPSAKAAKLAFESFRWDRDARTLDAR